MQNREKMLAQDEDAVEQTVLKWLSEFEFASFGVSVHAATEDKMVAQKTLQPRLIHAIAERFGVPLRFESPDLVLLLDLERKRMAVSLKSVFVEGRYCKFARDVAQTIHFCRHCRGHGCETCKYTGKTTADSVQQIVSAVLVPAFGATDGLFHGAGREDVDARMLGTGRPFVFELAEPLKRSADLHALAEKINADPRVRVTFSGIVDKDRMREVKMSAHDKVYEALVEATGPVDRATLESFIGTTIPVKQRTPLRVVKRRADLVHEKRAEILRIEWLTDASFRARIRASAGLYIKEFVSGDSERTTPSVSEIAKTLCACKELDVLEIVG
jgi:tRNA pseudouridine synthase 10